MEQTNQPKGDADEIIGQQDEHVAREHVVYERATPERPPVAFAEAEQHNAYALLTELHEHALTISAGPERAEDPRHRLAELALSSAVVAWWSRWQPIMMHEALSAGASLAEVAAAAGLPEAEAYERWSVWTEQQSRHRSGGQPGVQPGVDPEEVAAIRTRLADQAVP